MTPRQRLGLELHLPRLRARRRRRELEQMGAVLSVDDVYALALAEHEDEAKASEAATQHAMALLRAGRTPE